MSAINRILGAATPLRQPFDHERTSPASAVTYAMLMVKGRWPEGEPVIATSPKWSALYAINVIKDRFPEGEAAISKDPEWAYVYARDVLRRRWVEGESTIAGSPVWRRYYMQLFPDVESDWSAYGWVDWLDT